MSYLLTFSLAFLLAVATLPLVIRLAHARGWFDRSGGRKIHAGSVPRLGGIGIALSFALTTILVYAVFAPSGRLPSPGLSFWLLMLAGLAYHLLGLADDFLDLKGRLKLFIQVLIAALIVALGYGFTEIELPFSPWRLELGWFGPLLTMLWIVGMVNAMNLIDGMDGLAGGVAFIACAFWAVLFYKEAQYLPAIVATAAGGAILGFLFFNFPPANIFMGDSGALFLGFLLAVLPLIGGGGHREDTGLLPAVTIALVPVLDTIAAIIRRWRKGISFFTADRYHLHHKLLTMGFSTRQTLAIVFGFCLILGAAASSSLYLGEAASFAMMIASWAVVSAFFVFMHYVKEKDIKISAREGDPGKGQGS